MAELYIGTSGWSYDDWRERFYPAGLKQEGFLSHYAKRFPTTEVNYSFYHLPKIATYEKWASQVPDGFVFAVKASKQITHNRRLIGVADQWREFLGHAQTLGAKLGPILLQLPPSFRSNLDVLEAFLEAAPDLQVGSPGH